MAFHDLIRHFFSVSCADEVKYKTRRIVPRFNEFKSFAMHVFGENASTTFIFILIYNVFKQKFQTNCSYF